MLFQQHQEMTVNVLPEKKRGRPRGQAKPKTEKYMSGIQNHPETCKV